MLDNLHASSTTEAGKNQAEPSRVLGTSGADVERKYREKCPRYIALLFVWPNPILDEASTSNCTCLPVQLFLQMEKDNVDSALAALQREHNKLRDVYKCALEDRKRDKEEMDRLARKVAKLPVAESS